MPKECFVICPFGKENSETREWSDKIFEYIIMPVAEEKQYSTSRSIDDPQPGEITVQITEKLFNSDLVIADLTGSNPNVFYELALRHCIAKPFIHLAGNPEDIPFDIQQLNVIKIGTDVKIVEKAKSELFEQIDKIEKKTVHFDNPASRNRKIFDFSSAKAFLWEINYSNTLAPDWLKEQDSFFQQYVSEFLNDETGVPETETRRQLLAEYLAYKGAHGTNAIGTLYYHYIRRDIGALTGWAALNFAGEQKPVHIRINGRERNDGVIIIKFHQEARRVLIAPKIDASVGPFSYAIKFKPDPVGKTLVGKFYHPHCNDVRVGKAELTSIV